MGTKGNLRVVGVSPRGVSKSDRKHRFETADYADFTKRWGKVIVSDYRNRMLLICGALPDTRVARRYEPSSIRDYRKRAALP